MSKIYHGQVHQDRFVETMMAGKIGTYIEIGASHPVTLSNTYALELAGWTGYSLELDPMYVDLWARTRVNPLIITDALTYTHPLVPRVDYLSVDIAPPEATFRALQQMMSLPMRYSIITFETDAYDDPRWVAPSRELMLGLGYALVRPDVVCPPYGPFEDWYVDPLVIPPERERLFK